MKILDWCEDRPTRTWADRCLLITMGKQPQYNGANKNPLVRTWSKYTLTKGFPLYCNAIGWTGRLRPSPENIIRCWTEGHELEALALTVVWGSMSRTVNTIYGADLPIIQQHLCDARDSIVATNSIKKAWEILTSGLGWTPVMTSKCLHYLARSMGFEQNPPVPIDHAVVQLRVAPKFDVLIRQSGGNPKALGVWFDKRDSWAGYTCYMTTILAWSRAKQWTTTETENTVFEQFR